MAVTRVLTVDVLVRVICVVKASPITKTGWTMGRVVVRILVEVMVLTTVGRTMDVPGTVMVVVLEVAVMVDVRPIRAPTPVYVNCVEHSNDPNKDSKSSIVISRSISDKLGNFWVSQW